MRAVVLSRGDRRRPRHLPVTRGDRPIARALSDSAYTYKAAGTNGAGQIATIDGPLTNDTIAYTYDELGRVIQRTINGSANQVDWTFDALGRVTSEENLLGEFTYTYDGVTNRLATVTYPMQRREGVLLDRLDRHRAEVFVSARFEHAARVCAVGLVAQDIGPPLRRRQEDDAVSKALDLARPEVRGAARLHHDGRRRPIREELGELRAR